MTNSSRIPAALLCLLIPLAAHAQPAAVQAPEGGKAVPGISDEVSTSAASAIPANREIPNVETRDRAHFQADLKDFRPDMRVFTDGAGHYVVEAASFSLVVESRRKYLSNRFFWGDGTTLTQLNGVGFARNPDESYSVRFEEPKLAGTNEEASFDVDSGRGSMRLKCGRHEAKFTELKDTSADAIRMKAAFAPLPLVHQPEYLFKNGAQYIFVNSSKYNPGFDTFRVFVGTPGKMTLHPIAQMAVFTDGQTMLITTRKNETLFVPGEQMAGAPATWERTKKLQTIDLKTFDLAQLGIETASARSPASLSTPCEALK